MLGYAGISYNGQQSDAWSYYDIGLPAQERRRGHLPILSRLAGSCESDKGGDFSAKPWRKWTPTLQSDR
jgi:hypothetical protein